MYILVEVSAISIKDIPMDIKKLKLLISTVKLLSRSVLKICNPIQCSLRVAVSH